MAATEKDPPSVAGREGTLNWSPDPKKPNQWLAPDGDRAPARITLLRGIDLGEPQEVYHVYRNGEYLGPETSLKDAKGLAAIDKPNALYLLSRIGGVDGIPAFLVITDQERAIMRSKAPPLTSSEQRNSWKNTKLRLAADPTRINGRPAFMAKYDGMNENQLTLEYNKLVDTARELGLDRFRPVSRFKNTDEGLKYIESVESSIRARQTSEKAVKTNAGGKTGKEVATPPAPKPEPQPKGEDTMATKAKKSAAKKAAPKKGAKKAAKKAAAPKAAKGPKEYERPSGKVGEFTAKLGTRPGTNRDKLAVHLFQNLGKQVPTADVCRAVYGKKEAVPAINNVVNGMRLDLAAAKMSYTIKREENSIGLYAGSK